MDQSVDKKFVSKILGICLERWQKFEEDFGLLSLDITEDMSVTLSGRMLKVRYKNSSVYHKDYDFDEHGHQIYDTYRLIREKRRRKYVADVIRHLRNNNMY